MVAQPLEMIIIFLLFNGAFTLPIAMVWYYTPWKANRPLSNSEYIRYCNDRDSGYRYRIRFEKYFFANIFLSLTFLYFFGWLAG
jgi:hypothetical protein